MKGGQDLVKLAGESWKWEVGSSKKGDLGPVVQTLDSAIHHYPVNEYLGKKLCYPVDSELSGGWCYPTCEQPGLATFS